MRTYDYTVLSAINAAIGGNSIAFNTRNIFMFSIQAIGTGSPNCNIKIQVSNDIGDQQANQSFQPTNWTDLSGATVTVNAASAFIIPKTEICYNWIRVVCASGGTGTITVNLNGRGA